MQSHGEFGGNQNNFVDLYLLVGRALNKFLKHLNPFIILRRLEKGDGPIFTKLTLQNR